jgi:hypothetical protein
MAERLKSNFSLPPFGKIGKIVIAEEHQYLAQEILK